MKNFYVYYSYEEWGRGYIGKRECLCLPEEDVKYFGSYKDKTFKPTQKIILEKFATREEAYAAEVVLHRLFEVDKNPHFANRAKQTATRFSKDATGLKRSKEFCEKVAQATLKENLSEETLRRRSESLKKYYSSEEARKRSSEMAKEIGSRPETKRKRSEAAKRVAKDPAVAEKRRLAAQKTFATEESRQRRVAAALAREAKKRADRVKPS